MRFFDYKPTKTFSERPGLYLENGVVMHEGKPFYGIGANYFGAFINEYKDPEAGELRTVLSMLRDHNIKYMRVNWGLFWPTDYRDMFADLDKYYDAMDRVVAAAEEFDIGIIGSFFWNISGINDYFGEPVKAWGDPKSDTRAFMKDYVKTVIGRYKESPAMWMWEFSNEFNLGIDLPNRRELREAAQPPLQLGSRIRHTDADDLMTDYGTEVYEEFGKLCRTYDIYDRMICSGNSEPRPKQYQIRVWDKWPERPDTRAEMAKTLEWHNPAPINCISVHTYGLLERFEGSETYSGLLKAFKEESTRLGRALFVGEFSGLDKEYSKQTIDAIVENRIPLSAVWAIGKVEYSLDNDPAVRDEILDYIAAANEKLGN